MKITARGVDAFIKSPPDTIAAVLLYGYDRGMVAERAQALAGAAVPDVHDPFAVSRLDPDAVAADPPLLRDSAAAMPATGGKRLVLVGDVGGAAGILTAAKNLLEAPPPESLTIITADDSVNTRSALVRLFDGNDAAAGIGCYPDTERSLGDLARGMFGEANIKVDTDALAWITAHLGADHMASRREIEKLVLLAGEGGHLDLATVRGALGDGAAITANDVVHAAASGDVKALSRALARANAEGIAGEQVLRGAVYYFTRLFRIGAAQAAGASRDEAMKSVRPPVFFAEQRMVESHLARWSPALCRRAIDRLAAAEMQSRKGVDSSITSAQALLSLASAARR